MLKVLLSNTKDGKVILMGDVWKSQSPNNRLLNLRLFLVAVDVFSEMHQVAGLFALADADIDKASEDLEEELLHLMMELFGVMEVNSHASDPD